MLSYLNRTLQFPKLSWKVMFNEPLTSEISSQRQALFFYFRITSTLIVSIMCNPGWASVLRYLVKYYAEGHFCEGIFLNEIYI